MFQNGKYKLYTKGNPMFVLFLFIMAISLATVAGAFSIFGLMAIYPASAIGVMIGAIIIEFCKLATISFLYQFYPVLTWGKKSIATFFITVAMLITSMGVYGYLTKGYIQQIAPMANAEVQISTIEGSIARHQFDIDQAINQLKLMDAATARYIELGAVSKSVTVNDQRDAERARYTNIIKQNNDSIFELRTEKTGLMVELQKIEAEVGPIQYVADLIFKEGSTSRDTVLKWFSIIMVIAVDPFAVALLVFANAAYRYRNDPRLNTEFGGLFHDKNGDKENKGDTINHVGDNLSQEEMFKRVQEMLKEKAEQETTIPEPKIKPKRVDTLQEQLQDIVEDKSTTNNSVVNTVEDEEHYDSQSEQVIPEEYEVSEDVPEKETKKENEIKNKSNKNNWL